MPKKKPTIEMASFSVRMPLELKERIQEFAGSRRWSAAVALNYLVEQGLEAQK